MLGARRPRSGPAIKAHRRCPATPCPSGHAGLPLRVLPTCAGRAEKVQPRSGIRRRVWHRHREARRYPTVVMYLLDDDEVLIQFLIERSGTTELLPTLRNGWRVRVRALQTSMPWN